MRAPLKALLLGGGALIVGLGGWRIVDDWQDRREITRLRADLRVLRNQADSCQVAVSQREIMFRDYDRRVDSLRDEVSSYEGLHPEGVPADTYRVYLETFEAYNEAVPAWEMQVDSLRADWEACREMVDEHNEHADSLRLRLQQMELMDP